MYHCTELLSHPFPLGLQSDSLKPVIDTEFPVVSVVVRFSVILQPAGSSNSPLLQTPRYSSPLFMDFYLLLRQELLNTVLCSITAPSHLLLGFSCLTMGSCLTPIRANQVQFHSVLYVYF